MCSKFSESNGTTSCSLINRLEGEDTGFTLETPFHKNLLLRCLRTNGGLSWVSPGCAVLSMELISIHVVEIQPQTLKSFF